MSCVLKQSINAIFSEDIDCTQYNRQYLEKFNSSAPHRLSAGSMMFLLDPNDQDAALSVATSLSDDITDVTIQVSTRKLCGGSFELPAIVNLNSKYRFKYIVKTKNSLLLIIALNLIEYVWRCYAKLHQLILESIVDLSISFY